MNLSWNAQAKLEHCTSVVPGMRRYVTSRCRFLLGLEALRNQYIWYPSEVAGELYIMPSKFLAGLAGNYFDGGCYSAVLLSTCVFLAQGAAVRLNCHLILMPKTEARAFVVGHQHRLIL